MSTIEERLEQLIQAQAKLTAYNMKGRALITMQENQRARRDALLASIEADWQAMVEALELFVKAELMAEGELCEATAHEMDGLQQRAVELGGAILARVKGEGS